MHWQLYLKPSLVQVTARLQTIYIVNISLSVTWMPLNLKFTWKIYLCCLFEFQVVTRLIASSCPVVFWYAAHLTLSEGTLSPQSNNTGYRERLKKQTCRSQHCSQYKRQTRHVYCPCGDSSLDIRKNEIIVLCMRWNEQSYITQLILCYFVGYCIIGTALHCNFLPWT